MAKLIKDISKTQKRISYRLLEKTLGAKQIGIKIDTRKAPIFLFELRQFIMEKLISSGGRPKLDGASKKRNKIPFLEDDWDKLKSIADYYKKKDGINISPGQLVSAIVHSFISHIDIAKEVKE